MIELPPDEIGAFQVTVALASPAVAVTFVGGPGTLRGVTAFESADGGESPVPFIATTEKR